MALRIMSRDKLRVTTRDHVHAVPSKARLLARMFDPELAPPSYVRPAVAEGHGLASWVLGGMVMAGPVQPR